MMPRIKLQRQNIAVVYMTASGNMSISCRRKRHYYLIAAAVVVAEVISVVQARTAEN